MRTATRAPRLWLRVLGDFVAEAEHFCDEGCGDFLDQAADGCVARASEIDADFPQLFHEGVGVEVLPCAVAVPDGDVCAGPVLDLPDEEGPDGVPGGGSISQPCIHVGPNAGSNRPPMGGFEPGKEFDGFGDFLLRAVHGAAGGSSVTRQASDAAQVMPEDERLDGSPNLGVINPTELAG